MTHIGTMNQERLARVLLELVKARRVAAAQAKEQEPVAKSDPHLLTA